MATASLGRSTARPTSSLARGVAALQGLYYVATGVWPLVSMETFLAVTGDKTDHLQSPHQGLYDHWLVVTVGVLVLAIGAALLVAAWRGPSAEAVTLAVGSIIGLTAVDVVYVSRKVIGPVYLLDALGEVVLLVGWLVAALQANRGTPVEIPAPGLHR
jgi:hypothetical protein